MKKSPPTPYAAGPSGSIAHRRNGRGRTLLLTALLSATPAGVLLLNSAAANAQTGGEAGIQGTVVDSTGAAIPNAKVVAVKGPAQEREIYVR